MNDEQKNTEAEDAAADSPWPAGCFSSWLRRTRSALIHDRGADVPCGSCNACCRSGYFIHLRPEERETISRINKKLLFAAPGLAKGNLLLGHFADGSCPLLISDKCSIYQHRSLTCRIYDCRIFAAAGITAGDKELITASARHWKFSYPTPGDYQMHQAVKDAARFLQERGDWFPAGVPSNPSQVAILAIKVYGVFLKKNAAGAAASTIDDRETAAAVIAANERFETKHDQRKLKLCQ